MTETVLIFKFLRQKGFTYVVGSTFNNGIQRQQKNKCFRKKKELPMLIFLLSLFQRQRQYKHNGICTVDG